MKVWFNGALRSPYGLIDANDRGFLLGDGAFETIAVFDGTPAFLGAHLDRLRDGLDLLNIPWPEPLSRAGDIIGELARINDVTGPASARITVTRGPAERGLAPPKEKILSPSSLITVASASGARRERSRMIIATQRRYAGAAHHRFKSISGYAANIAAMGEAQAARADDAVLLTEKGDVACATAANIFAISADGVIKTPPLENGAMPGVVRKVLLSADLPISEEKISPDELARSALFLTNSLIGLREASLAEAETRPMMKIGGALNLFKRAQICYGEALAADLAAAGRKS